jgi:hypothetical protein
MFFYVCKNVKNVFHPEIPRNVSQILVIIF